MHQISSVPQKIKSASEREYGALLAQWSTERCAAQKAQVPDYSDGESIYAGAMMSSHFTQFHARSVYVFGDAGRAGEGISKRHRHGRPGAAEQLPL